MPKRRVQLKSRREIRPVHWFVLFLAVFPLVFFSREVRALLLFILRPEINDSILRAVGLTLFELFVGCLAVFAAWTLLVAGQAIVPVNSFRERIRAAWHFFLSIFGWHGIATAIRDGKIMTSREARRDYFGLLIIDFNSAVVLEENVPVPDISRVIKRVKNSLIASLGLMDDAESPRVCGPGLVFLRPTAYVHSVVDLRRQNRSRPDVSAYTRDGIEIKTSISAMFSVGHSPDLLTFTLQGGRGAEHLRLVELKEVSGGKVQIDKVRSDFIHDLDLDDWNEIQQRLTSLSPSQTRFNYSPQPKGATIPSFHTRRVFSAAFSDALDEEGSVIPWEQLPVKVATDLYRQLLLEYNYDQLYNLGGEEYPIQSIRSKLSLRLRNNGMLSFRLLLRRDRLPLQAGEAVKYADLRVSQVFPLTSPKVLRNAGIAVLGSGFGDLAPVSPEVYRQRLNSWRAVWESETKTIEAGRELDAIREGTRARMQTQQDLVRRLRQVLDSSARAPEAAAIQLYLELEALTRDPVTRQLLPGDTILLMRSLHEWINLTGSSGGPSLLGDGRRI